MNTKHIGLWQRLEQFQLDSPEAALPFSGRLAKENHWSAKHTRRVMTEYKRFAFLAVTAGHPVSPSEDVDQAWHLHLTYTENYWKTFCGEVLEMPLHHHPTEGGNKEREKFQDWYARTLESYEQFFGEPAPSDIWPPATVRKNLNHEFARVDRLRNWIIPKPTLRFIARTASVGVLGLLLTLFCGAMFEQGLDPFDWRGPDFLGFYLILAAVCFGAATWLRRRLRLPVDSRLEDVSGLDAYDMAYLNGGAALAVNTAVAVLVNQGAMRIDEKRRRIVSLILKPAQMHSLERVVYAAADSTDGEKLMNVRAIAQSGVEAIAEKLEKRGLAVAPDQRLKAMGFPLAIAAIVPIAGVIKITIGLHRDRPVGILIFLTILCFLVALVGFVRPPRRSLRGDAVLERLRSIASRKTLPSSTASLSAVELATVVGLFGLVALQGTALAELYRSLRMPGGISCGTSGSGCSSSGCGGGSSCGGGGGGGCGGCGGGH